MIILAKIILVIASLFAALSLACAVFVGRRAPSQERHFGVAPRRIKRASHAPAGDAYAEPFGDVPGTGFTTEQLRKIAPPVVTRDPLLRSFAPDETICQADRLRHEFQSGPALRPDAGSGGVNGRPFPSGRPATVRGFLGKDRR